jgi:hypothetical protein
VRFQPYSACRNACLPTLRQAGYGCVCGGYTAWHILDAAIVSGRDDRSLWCLSESGEQSTFDMQVD